MKHILGAGLIVSWFIIFALIFTISDMEKERNERLEMVGRQLDSLWYELYHYNFDRDLGHDANLYLYNHCNDLLYLKARALKP